MKIKAFWHICLLFAVVFGVAGIAFAQDGINRVEFFGGYSHNRVDTGLTSEDFEGDEEFGRRIGTNGVNLSLTGNLTKYFGLKVDFAHHRKTDAFDFEGVNVDTKYSNNTFMGGIQIKNNKKDGPRAKPFFHALAGVARQKLSFSAPTEDFEASLTQSNFTFAVGGGLDVRVSKRVDIRVFQIDYNPTYIKDQDFDDFTLEGMAQHNFRFGFGIVIH